MRVIGFSAAIVALMAATSGWSQAPSRVEPSREVSSRSMSRMETDVVGIIRFEPTGLSLLRPYQRGKIPVVFVHGLWSNPWSWSRMIESLEADPALRDRYQFWTFGYSTGDPLPYSASCCEATWMRCGASSTPTARMRRSTGWSSSATAWAAC